MARLWCKPAPVAPLKAGLKPGAKARPPIPAADIVATALGTGGLLLIGLLTAAIFGG